MVKKQTIWLLTMLSLVVILSIYYLMTPPTSSNNLVNVERGNESAAEVVNETDPGSMFTALRLEIEDKRSVQKEELQSIVASSSFTSEEKNEALDKMTQLQDISSKEVLLETLIKSSGFEDALVQAEGSEVLITVVAEEHSRTKANEIIQLTMGELGNKKVSVTFKVPEK